MKKIFLFLFLFLLLISGASAAGDNVDVQLQVIDGVAPPPPPPPVGEESQGGIVLPIKKKINRPFNIPPVFFDVVTDPIDSTSAVMKFHNDENVVCRIDFGKTLDFEAGMIGEIYFSIEHLAKMEDLSPNTNYLYKILCVDEVNLRSDYFGEFVTLPLAENKIVEKPPVVIEKEVEKKEVVIEVLPKEEKKVEEKAVLVLPEEKKQEKQEENKIPNIEDKDVTDNSFLSVLFFQRGVNISPNEKHELQVIGGQPVKLSFPEVPKDSEKFNISFDYSGKQISYAITPSGERVVDLAGILIPDKTGKWPFVVSVYDKNDKIVGEYVGAFNVQNGGFSGVAGGFSFWNILLFVLLVIFIGLVIYFSIRKSLTRR